MSQGTENKNTGSFYTPEWCADILLEMSGFSSLSPDVKLSSRVIDPACGDGAILVRIVDSSLSEFSTAGVGKDDMKAWVENNVYGFELDSIEAEKSAENIAAACKRYGISLVPNDIHIIVGDALSTYKEHVGKFDYAIGNPPYVRIHNLDEKPESPYIEGMCDLYYAFYDIGQQLLTSGGKLCFISPSSWMTSKSGAPMRKDLESRRCIENILNFGHYQVFDNATTYTSITVLGTSASDEIGIWEFNEEERTVHKTCSAPSESFWCGGNFYPSDVSDIAEILEFDVDAGSSDIVVRNGYATLCDKAYLVDADDDVDGCVIDVVKASRGTTQKMVYPYDDRGYLIPEAEMKSRFPRTYAQLASWKDKLLARNKVEPGRWWGFGRSQGICDTYKDKVTVQAIVRPDREIVTAPAPAGTGVYGGIYVLGIPESMLREALADEAFLKYVIALSKYKSGEYYTFSGKELQRYLRWREENSQESACSQ